MSRSASSQSSMLQPYSAAPLNTDLIGPCGAVGLGLPVQGGPRIQHVVRRPQVPTGPGAHGGRTHAPTAPPPSYLHSSVYRHRVRAGTGTSDFTILPLIGVFVKSWKGTLQHRFAPARPIWVTGPTSSCRDASWRTGRLLQQPSYSY
jgi:hypothetical protein